MATIQRITPFLWFDSQAEEAATFYAGIFPDSRVGQVTRYSEAGKEVHGRPAGMAMVVEFSLCGQGFRALNGGPGFRFTEAVSFQVACDTQDEIDTYWERLTAGGDPAAQQCGWLKDRFGLSWQVVPSMMGHLMSDPEPGKSERVMQALLRMKKLDIDALRNA
ncbi:MAG TPA: VOC family protein [Gemmatimonadales bacterium]|jgi:predicted 3-demethylubiquinone-9 3-methyltransferase (glyoxalase superfamily)